ncbi:MAG: LCP family protein [Jiangellales bacterium]
MGLIPPGTYPDGASASPGDDGAADGLHAGRDQAERAQRDEQNHSFRTYLRRASLGSLVPGLGLILSGQRKAGVTMLLAFVALVGGAVALLVTRSRTELVGLAVDPLFLVAAAAALGLLALALLASSAYSHHRLQPAGIRGGQRLGGALVLVLVTSMVVAPVAMASRYALVQHELVTNVFTAADVDIDDDAPTDPVTGDPAPAPVDPWADVDRVNVLLIGSDAGAGREGTRPDTNIVASIDPETGDTVLFSLPRNLENVPFPPGSLLSSYYPFGWQGEPGDPGSELLNAIYRYAPAAHPGLFTDVEDPGAEAMKLAAEGVTGLPIDYYVMVDLDGFERVVDALGGIDMNVSQRVPLESSMLPAGYCSEPTYYLEPGQQRLNGYEALWYARVRCGGEGLSDDYDRMRRQRCVIGAMIDRADPLTVLRRYESLADTAQQIVSTDIPTSMVPAFAELGLRVQGGTTRSLPFTDRVINTGNPDFYGIQTQVRDAIDPPPPPTPTPGAPTTTPTSPEATPLPTAAPDATPGVTPEPPDESDGVLDLDAVC